MKFEEWLSQQNGVIEVDCGCVTTEAFYHWMRVAYEAGNSPVIPEGYVMVPKEPTAEMVIKMRYHVGGYDRNIKEGYKAMLAVAPQLPGSESATVPGKWIPVSERMPEDEQEVLTINKMGHRFVSFFDKHSGLFFDRLDAPAACCIERVLVTHWMPLPAAPQEVKSES